MKEFERGLEKNRKALREDGKVFGTANFQNWKRVEQNWNNNKAARKHKEVTPTRTVEMYWKQIRFNWHRSCSSPYNPTFHSKFKPENRNHISKLEFVCKHNIWKIAVKATLQKLLTDNFRKTYWYDKNVLNSNTESFKFRSAFISIWKQFSKTYKKYLEPSVWRMNNTLSVKNMVPCVHKQLVFQNLCPAPNPFYIIENESNNYDCTALIGPVALTIMLKLLDNSLLRNVFELWALAKA